MRNSLSKLSDTALRLELRSDGAVRDTQILNFSLQGTCTELLQIWFGTYRVVWLTIECDILPTSRNALIVLNSDNLALFHISLSPIRNPW